MENTVENKRLINEPFKNRALKVALVHDFLAKEGGAEKVTQVLSEIFPDAPIYTLLLSKNMQKMFSGRKINTSSLQKFYEKFNIPTKWLMFKMPRAIEEFDFSKFDVVISSSHSFAKGIITSPDTIHISYCHSPTRYLWDACHSYLEEQKLPGFIKFLLQPRLHNLRIWDRLAASRVDYFVANSNYVKNRIKKYYRKDAKVIYPPVEIPTNLTSNKKDYFLVLSRLSAYKKVDLAIQAFNKLGLSLVVIGDGEQLDELKQEASDNIKFLGFKEDNEKWEYLSSARALIFPGEEDFGIVPVEAMAAGLPVIAFNKGGLKESVADGKTGIFFKDQSVKSIVEAVQKFVEQEDTFITQELKSQAQKFNTERFKKEILEFISNVKS
ncbi:MAG: glycosyltransferase [Patescibacteria group bacterium]|nr:glycosyltransferase [Patescibacteria group bacterium]